MYGKNQNKEKLWKIYCDVCFFLFWLATVPVFVHIYAILDKLL